tara:strand:+ start:417 stop:866 length:450 start_codon:yes stop_codon:yes gene_type:complete
MVRAMRPGDEALIVALGKRMAKESEYFSGHTIDYTKWYNTCYKTLVDDNYQAYVSEQDGVINGIWAGMVIPVWFAEESKVTDIMFYVDKQKRGTTIALHLLNAAEHWAISKGVKSLSIGLSSGIDTESTVCFLERIGYNNSVVVMEKEL